MSSWNPSDKDGHVTLSNGNLDAIATTGDWWGVRGNVAQPIIGKGYFEIKVVGALTDPAGLIVGVGNASALLDVPAGTSNHFEGFQSDSAGRTGSDVSGSADPAFHGTFVSFGFGDVIGFALDAAANELYIYKNNTLLGDFRSLPTDGAFYPMAYLQDTTAVLRLADTGGLTYAPPPTFPAWDLGNQIRSTKTIGTGIYQRPMGGLF